MLSNLKLLMDMTNAAKGDIRYDAPFCCLLPAEDQSPAGILSMGRKPISQ